MSDNIAAKERTECTAVTIDGKRYEGFDLYTAMEEISYSLSKIRLMVEDLFAASDKYVVLYSDALRAGLLPAPVVGLGHSVYTRTGIILDNIVSIEAKLLRFDIHPE